MKLYQKAPEGLPLLDYPKYCSIDGDADRLVYFFLDENRRFHMLDGDRFSVLFAFFIASKLREAKLLEHVKMGVIQTAYANGSSTDYIVNTMVTIPSPPEAMLDRSVLESPSGLRTDRSETSASQSVGLRHWNLFRSQRARNSRWTAHESEGDLAGIRFCLVMN